MVKSLLEAVCTPDNFPKSRRNRLSFWELTGFLLRILPATYLFLPLKTLYYHLICRRHSTTIQEIGRTFFEDLFIRCARYVQRTSSIRQQRIYLSSLHSYKSVARSWKFRGWRNNIWDQSICGGRVNVKWIAQDSKPATKEDLVLYFIHGGGFVTDSGPTALPWLFNLVNQVNQVLELEKINPWDADPKTKTVCGSFKVLMLDYRLSPEFVFPTQVIEVLEGYKFLVDELQIPTSSICITGESTGCTIVTSLLLHLSRPCSLITKPQDFGLLPYKPGSVMLLSPVIKLISEVNENQNRAHDILDPDFISQVPFYYVGVNPVFTGTSDEVTCLEKLQLAYVNPDMVKDGGWWKEAYPGQGRTLIAWGGKELFSESIKEHFLHIEEAGVKPEALYKPLGCHNWVVLDQSIPGLFKTRSNGSDSLRDYGLAKTIRFIESMPSLKNNFYSDYTSSVPTSTRSTSSLLDRKSTHHYSIPRAVENDLKQACGIALNSGTLIQAKTRTLSGRSTPIPILQKDLHATRHSSQLLPYSVPSTRMHMDYSYQYDTPSVNTDQQGSEIQRIESQDSGEDLSFPDPCPEREELHLRLDIPGGHLEPRTSFNSDMSFDSSSVISEDDTFSQRSTEGDDLRIEESGVLVNRSDIESLSVANLCLGSSDSEEEHSNSFRSFPSTTSI